jgi:hypothetical protein
MSKNMRTFTVTFTATVEVDATTPSQADSIVEDSLCQGYWREINALDIHSTTVKGVEEEDAIDDELSAGWPRWCEQCKKVKPFKTPAGMTAPFTPTDWTDEAGHVAS